MAIPTQFTTTQQAGRPIANPLSPVDYAYVIDSLDAALISGAASYTPKTVPNIDTPVVSTSVAIQDIANATLVSSVAIPDIGAPEISAAQSIPTLSTPTANTSVAIPSIDLPTVRSSVAIPSIDLPTVRSSVAIPTLNTPVINTSVAIPTINTPVINTSVAIPTINTPTAFTSKGATDDTPPFPLNHARILYDNLLQLYTVVSANKGASTAIKALVPNTWEKWRFSAGGEIIITLPSNLNIDTVCIGAHNIADSGANIGAQYSTTEVGDNFLAFKTGVSPNKNTAIMFHIGTAVSVRRLKIIVSGIGDYEVGYISAGIAMQIQRPFFNDHNPYPDSDVTEYYSSRSESGNIIGRQIRRKGFETQAEVNNLSDTWYRTYFTDFKEKAKLQPFFMAWNLLEYPTDVAFAETTDDIRASMQNGSIVKRNISFSYRGV